jgi:hypothetical protein
MKRFAFSMLGSETESFDTIWNACDNNIITKKNYT